MVFQFSLHLVDAVAVQIGLLVKRFEIFRVAVSNCLKIVEIAFVDFGFLEFFNAVCVFNDLKRESPNVVFGGHIGFDRVEPLINGVELLIHGVESLIYGTEPLIYGRKVAVDGC